MHKTHTAAHLHALQPSLMITWAIIRTRTPGCMQLVILMIMLLALL
jgi:hypothetical protein